MVLWRKNTLSVIIEKLDTIRTQLSAIHMRMAGSQGNVRIESIDDRLDALTAVIKGQSEMISRLTDIIEGKKKLADMKRLVATYSGPYVSELPKVAVEVEDAKTEYYAVEYLDQDLANQNYIDGFTD